MSDMQITVECAVKLIKKGKAFVCDLSAEQIKEYRGVLKMPGRPSIASSIGWAKSYIG